MQLKIKKHLQWRHIKDRFLRRAVGLTAWVVVGTLLCMVGGIAWKGAGAFYKTTIVLDIPLNGKEFAPAVSDKKLGKTRKKRFEKSVSSSLENVPSSSLPTKIYNVTPLIHTDVKKKRAGDISQNDAIDTNINAYAMDVPGTGAVPHREKRTQGVLLPYRKRIAEVLARTLDLNDISAAETESLLALLSPTVDVVLYKAIQAFHETVPVPGADLVNSPVLRIAFRAADDVDQLMKAYMLHQSEEHGLIDEAQKIWLRALQEQRRLLWQFNKGFFTNSDSRDPAISGIWAAIVGSFYLLMVTFLFALPFGVGTAIYLEEFAPKNKFTEVIEVNLANLAAVPSVIYGLLGLSVFIGIFGLPRSSALTGGITLSLLMMPTVVIATRTSLKAVPRAIREAAFGLGASRVQTVFHHVLPLGMPGVITGVVLGLARSLGESAPLLMIGMAAFVAGVPQGVSDAAIGLPMQIFAWARSPERGFIENTAGAIMVLLLISGVMSYTAVCIRRRFEKHC